MHRVTLSVEAKDQYVDVAVHVVSTSDSNSKGSGNPTMLVNALRCQLVPICESILLFPTTGQFGADCFEREIITINGHEGVVTHRKSCSISKFSLTSANKILRHKKYLK